MYGMDLWGGSSGEGLKMMEQYNIMGDCSMMLTLGMDPDSTAPDQITDLTAIDPTSNSVTLNWTSPYDSSFGGIVSYDLRYSSDPIVTEDDFNNAASILIAGDPDSAGMSKSYIIHELAFSTQYYFAVKASDIWGNKSLMSNVPNLATWDAPEINITPDSIAHIILPDTTIADSIVISNTSTVNSTLDYSIEFINNTFPGEIYARLMPVNRLTDDVYSKENPDPYKGMSIRGSGGPDLFGYEWIDSNDPQGPVYEWNDISSTGTLVTNWIPTSIYTGTDEGKAGPFTLGFNFKFYGIEYTNIYFYSNGFISFVDYDDAYMSNGTIPSSSDPNNIIAAVWDDLDGGTNGHVYYKTEENKFIVQYTDWPGYYGGTGPFTFQVVLNKNGKIIIYYKTVQGSSNSATVGIENFDGSDGLQVANNATYLESNLAVQFSAEPEWLIADNLSGTIYNGNSLAVILNFITEDLELGNYSLDVVVSSNDPDNPQWTIPVSMEVSEVPVELTSFTAENTSDVVILKWKTSTEKNNMGFEVERKISNNQSEVNQWVKIGYVKGNGTTTEPKDYSLKDNNLMSGTIQYRLKQIDFNGSAHYSNKIEITVNNIPTEFALSQNYPNPFNPSTSIRYDIPVQSDVTINIYDGLGRLIRTLIDGVKEPGKYTLTWDGRNNYNQSVASGFYICKIKAGKFINIKKMLMLK
ncbi:MAG TPA: FlgD immunoglobulin-like domain containing protein, partial [Ignavibacteriaceae bacterium]|nr:FlgD immunoglobulin-like domain containing protein [Ignavibacteriaceae bacterium]